MPATEKTWRDNRTMHVIFACSSVVMLAVTVWMMVDDHYNRPWKDYTKKTIGADTWMATHRRIQLQTREYFEKQQELEEELARIRATAPEPKDLDDFVAIAKDCDKALPKGALDFASLKGDLEKLDSESTADADIARDSLLDALREVIDRIKAYEDRIDAKRKVKSADYDEARSKLDIANAHRASDGQSKRLQDEVNLVKESVDELVDRVEIAKEHRDLLKKIIGDLTADEEATKKKIVTHEASLVALHTQVAEGSDSVWRRLLASPILDIFGKHDIAIQQEWIPEKTLNFNFSKVARFDRCITCHRSIKKNYGSATTPSYLPESHITLTLRTPAAPPALNARDKVLGRYFSAEDLEALQNDEDGETGDGETGDGETGDGDPQVRRAVMLIQAYGLGLVQGGPLNSDDVAVSFAWPQSPAAKAGLQTGDVVEQINGAHVRNLGVALTLLVDTVEWGQPITLSVRRGVPHPYSTHPRLDLFGTAASPHPFGKMGCTLCHDGQGSATDFINPVHAPNSEAQRAEWRKKYGWYKNHHWPFPMYPKRFREATCLKCHHDVTELEPSERFPEPSAPKLVAGYNLVRRFGCFGCHEINGFDGPTKRIGPDLRAEPNYAAAAKQILFQLPDRRPPLAAKQKSLAATFAIAQSVLVGLKESDNKLRLGAKELKDAAKANESEPDQARLDAIQTGRDKLAPEIEKAEADVTTASAELQAVNARIAELQLAEDKADTVAERPEDNAARRRLLELIDDDTKREKTNPPLLTSSYPRNYVSAVLQDTDTPGRFRRVGPSLRHAGEKLSLEFITAWLEDPTHFRPTTRMPRFYGLHDHIEGEQKQQAERFERMEIRAISYFLLKNSQSFDHVDPPTAGTVAPPSAERGKRLFEVRGCLACHSHGDHPQGKADQGPDLSQIGAKLRLSGNDRGRRWLYSWVRQPNKYHARTVMPDLYLDEPTKDENGNPADAAADITEYLMKSGDWKPKNAAQPNWPPLATPASLDMADKQVLADLDSLRELTKIHLEKALRSKRLSEKFLDAAIDGKEGGQTTAVRMARQFRADEAALTGLSSANKAEKMLDYIGRRTISHRGCFGCHDVPGYEDAKPIGTALADWGRKDPSKLAYEQIAGYLDQKQGDHGDNHGGEGASLDDFFIRGLVSHHEVTRESFLWQKLREPRSYDYNKTENKGYLDQLRMPQFNFTSDQREQIMTFVLGLVAEPPGDVFVYKPSPRRKAILEGSKVLAQFNCAGCHPMSLDRWTLSYEPWQTLKGERFDFPQPAAGYDFLEHHFTEAEIERSKQQDPAGKLHAVLFGQPTREDATGRLAWFNEGSPVARPNEENLPIEYQFRLWQPTLLNGSPLRVGKILDIPRNQVEISPGVGGEFARLLHSTLLRIEAAKGTIPGARRQEIAGSVPPPLVGEGLKVQADWLHDFLLEPYRIRPAAELRMPRFTMSADEATKIVDYFAARDHTDYPYQSDSRTRATHLAAADARYYAGLKQSLSPAQLAARMKANAAFSGTKNLRLGDALRIVVSNDYCVKCHRVGDFKPAKAPSGQAPNLADAHRRLRPDYLLRWLANPARILPYTSMPQNIEPNKQVPAALYHGTGREQLDALVDLLMNYDRYMEHRTSIAEMVPPPPKVAVPPPEKVQEAPPPQENNSVFFRAIRG